MIKIWDLYQWKESDDTRERLDLHTGGAFAIVQTASILPQGDLKKSRYGMQ